MFAASDVCDAPRGLELKLREIVSVQVSDEMRNQVVVNNLLERGVVFKRKQSSHTASAHELAQVLVLLHQSFELRKIRGLKS